MGPAHAELPPQEALQLARVQKEMASAIWSMTRGASR